MSTGPPVKGPPFQLPHYPEPCPKSYNPEPLQKHHKPNQIANLFANSPGLKSIEKQFGLTTESSRKDFGGKTSRGSLCSYFTHFTQHGNRSSWELKLARNRLRNFPIQSSDLLPLNITFSLSILYGFPILSQKMHVASWERRRKFQWCIYSFLSIPYQGIMIHRKTLSEGTFLVYHRGSGWYVREMCFVLLFSVCYITRRNPCNKRPSYGRRSVPIGGRFLTKVRGCSLHVFQYQSLW